MNREIKFRGLRTDGKGWVYGVPYYISGERKCFIIDNCQSGKLTQEDSIFQGKEVEYKSVGQSTGLYDKNGTEIYEGDLVQWHNASGIHYNMGVVTWCNTKSAYVVRNHDYEDYIYDVHYARIEVIGNIHENIDLLNN